MERPSSEDELDKLTRSFEEQASKDLQRVSQLRAEAVQKKRKTSMKAIREEGLQTPLSEESKGYKMLAQMGYERGKGLGKNKDGRREPLELQLKERRTGLGVDEESKRKREEARTLQATRMAKRQQWGEVMQKSFEELQASRVADRRHEGQLRSARKVVETLDRRKGVEESFMWPLPDDQEEEETNRADAKEKSEATEKKSANPLWEEQPVEKKLDCVLTYLRDDHHYCLYCGCQYNSAEDLLENCPGSLEEDH